MTNSSPDLRPLESLTEIELNEVIARTLENWPHLDMRLRGNSNSIEKLLREVFHRRIVQPTEQQDKPV